MAKVKVTKKDVSLLNTILHPYWPDHIKADLENLLARVQKAVK